MSAEGCPGSRVMQFGAEGLGRPLDADGDVGVHGGLPEQEKRAASETPALTAPFQGDSQGQKRPWALRRLRPRPGRSHGTAYTGRQAQSEKEVAGEPPRAGETRNTFAVINIVPCACAFLQSGVSLP